MKVVDLHPDELLDKEARGELTALDRERLEAHLERCETCRFERECREDFAAELLAGEDEELPSQRLVQLDSIAPMPVIEATAKRESVPPAPRESVPPASEDRESIPEIPGLGRISSRPGRMRRGVRVTLLVAAALLIGSAATAAAGGGRVWAEVASALSLETTDTTSMAPAEQAAAPSAKAARASKHEVAPMPTELVVPDTTAEPAPAIIPVSMAPSAAGLAPSAAPVENAATLFEAANKARNTGDYGRAITLHRKLETTYPQSREAHTSYATLGRLLLDRGDPMGALEAFDAYQKRGSGPLDEAVLVGRATAQERIGRDVESRATWTQLLRDFPDTPYREHAESKLKGAADSKGSGR